MKRSRESESSPGGWPGIGGDESVQHDPILDYRRRFLGQAANVAGLFALASLLRDEGLLAGPSAERGINPLAVQPPHYAPKAKACIFIYFEGAPSQIDLFDPKPKLNELDG